MKYKKKLSNFSYGARLLTADSDFGKLHWYDCTLKNTKNWVIQLTNINTTINVNFTITKLKKKNGSTSDRTYEVTLNCIQGFP